MNSKRYMKSRNLITSLVLLLIFISCGNEKTQSNKAKKTTELKSLCAESLNEGFLRLEVKCENCEIKYSLLNDNGKEKGQDKNQSKWCKELKASPTDIIGLFATKLLNDKPIEFTIESSKFKEGESGDSIEVRAYYNNNLIKRAIGNGYAGLSMLEIPNSKHIIKKLKIKDCIGQNIFDVVHKHSKSSPQTLKGTDNKKWIVYYEDINKTFVVSKSDDVISEAFNGRKQ